MNWLKELVSATYFSREKVLKKQTFTVVDPEAYADKLRPISVVLSSESSVVDAEAAEIAVVSVFWEDSGLLVYEKRGSKEEIEARYDQIVDQLEEIHDLVLSKNLTEAESLMSEFLRDLYIEKPVAETAPRVSFLSRVAEAVTPLRKTEVLPHSEPTLCFEKDGKWFEFWDEADTNIGKLRNFLQVFSKNSLKLLVRGILPKPILDYLDETDVPPIDIEKKVADVLLSLHKQGKLKKFREVVSNTRINHKYENGVLSYTIEWEGKKFSERVSHVKDWSKVKFYAIEDFVKSLLNKGG